MHCVICPGKASIRTLCIHEVTGVQAIRLKNDSGQNDDASNGEYIGGVCNEFDLNDVGESSVEEI